MNPRQFALFLGFYFYVLDVNAANNAQRVVLLSSLIQIRAPKAQLLLWNQRRRRRRGRHFSSFLLLFARFCQDHSSRGYIQIILIIQFLETISIRSRCYWIFFARALQVKMWSEKKLSFHWIEWRKTIFVCCSRKVVLQGRTTAPLKICLRGQIFVRVETSRSHLVWSTDVWNLTDFFLIKTNLSKFCPKCDLGLVV